MKVEWKSELADVEGQIRQGRLRPASARLRILAPDFFSQRSDSVAEATRLHFAQLCRRAGVAGLGLRALKPSVRPGARRESKNSASPAVITEYAALLLRLGATTEASHWLARVNASDIPEKLLFEAFACFRGWDYARAVPLLQAYCTDPRLSDYSRLIGQLNLAVALTDTRRDSAAESLLMEILRNCESGGHRLLYGNALETQIQLRVFQGRGSDALALLREAEAKGYLLPGGEGLLFRKWEAIALRNDDPQSAVAKRRLLSLQQEAQSLNAWEVVRDCDYHEARIQSDPGRMEKLFFGTPFPAYRERILELGFAPRGSSYVWRLRRGRKPSRIDTCAGSIDSARFPEIRPGSLGLRLLQTLASDFYRPWRVAELHASLYPEQHFDWTSSSLRVHQIVHRVRAVLQESGCPIRIEEFKESYRLSSLGPVLVRVAEPYSSGVGGRTRDFYEKLKQEFQPGQLFSADDAAKRLGIAGRTLRRFLVEGMRSGKLEKKGVTRSARYALPCST